MTNVAIFVASHLSYDNQAELLEICIESLLSQTVFADIYISISFSKPEQKQQMSDIIKCYGSFDHIKFVINKERLSQMEHVKKLTNLFASKYDMIMFCNDTDTYHTERVSIFIEILDECYNMSSYDLTGIKEVPLNTNEPSYWNYCLNSKILIEFFNRMSSRLDLLQHSYSSKFLIYFLMYARVAGFNPCVEYPVVPTSKMTDKTNEILYNRGLLLDNNHIEDVKISTIDQKYNELLSKAMIPAKLCSDKMFMAKAKYIAHTPARINEVRQLRAFCKTLYK